MIRIILMVALSLLAPAAYADAIAQAVNKAGGILTLTNVACVDAPGTYIAYSTGKDGSRTIFGCWFYTRPDVMIQWSGGDVSTFPAVMFDSVSDRATVRSY